MMASHDSALLRLYRLATTALGPVLPLWINRRARAGKEDPLRTNERYGIASLPRPNGPLVWLHGASVGECTMLLPLIFKLKDARPDIAVLVTSGTVTAANLMKQRLPEGASHQYVPLDRRKYVSRFLAHWRPDTAIWAESEIWPNLITQTQLSGAKLALINARMSKKSLDGWRKRAGSALAIFSKFDLILAADTSTANELSHFTSKDVALIGNLKDAALPLPADKAKLSSLEKAVEERPIWCAASTHAGEDTIVLQAHQSVLRNHPNTILILTPRHPERRDEIVKLINAMGLTFCTRSSGHLPDTDTQVYLFDSIGEMGIAFRLAPITVMGGSLNENLSGHNPLEPARLGSAVLSGPYVSSFAETYAAMPMVKTVTSAKDISTEISHLLSNKTALTQLQTEAREFCAARSDVLDRVWGQLLPLLSPELTRGTPS